MNRRSFTMLLNLDDALRGLRLALDYEVVDLGTLPKSDARTGYGSSLVSPPLRRLSARRRCMNRQFLARSCCTTPAAMCFWAAAFVLVYGAGLFMRSVWPALQPFGDTLLLGSLGAACFINFTRNRTLHCGITGPLFVVAGVAAALIEGGLWDFDMTVVWAIVLMGVGIAFLLEWRTVGQANGPDARNAARP